MTRAASFRGTYEGRCGSFGRAEMVGRSAHTESQRGGRPVPCAMPLYTD